MRNTAATLTTLVVTLSSSLHVSANRSSFRVHPEDNVEEDKARPNQFWPFPDINLPGLKPPTDPPTSAPTSAPTKPKEGFFPQLPNLPNLPGLPNLPNLPWIPGGGGGEEANEPKPAPVPPPGAPAPIIKAPGPAPAPRPAPIPSPDEDTPILDMCVEARYIPWEEYPIEEQLVLATSLGYNGGTWNREGTNPRERASWNKLEVKEQETWGSLGYMSESYDCFINHYDAYSWSELQEVGLDLYLERLGATEQLWDAYDIPEAYRWDWDELTDDEQDAATRLCYVEDNWNTNPLEDYTWNC